MLNKKTKNNFVVAYWMFRLNSARISVLLITNFYSFRIQTYSRTRECIDQNPLKEFFAWLFVSKRNFLWQIWGSVSDKFNQYSSIEGNISFQSFIENKLYFPIYLHHLIVLCFFIYTRGTRAKLGLEILPILLILEKQNKLRSNREKLLFVV